jgi:hypothetical protein
MVFIVTPIFCILLLKVMLKSWDHDFILVLVILFFWWQGQDGPAIGCGPDGRGVIPDKSKK